MNMRSRRHPRTANFKFSLPEASVSTCRTPHNVAFRMAAALAAQKGLHGDFSTSVTTPSNASWRCGSLYRGLRRRAGGDWPHSVDDQRLLGLGSPLRWRVEASGLDFAHITEQTVQAFRAHDCECPGGRRWRQVSRAYTALVQRFVGYLCEQGAISGAWKLTH
jgi:hypothetical protein